jgi:hypothetical protein
MGCAAVRRQKGATVHIEREARICRKPQKITKRFEKDVELLCSNSISRGGHLAAVWSIGVMPWLEYK